MRILIKNIKTLVQVEREGEERKSVAGSDMAHLPVLEDAYLAIEDGRIVDFGVMDEWPGIEDWRGLEVIDATDRIVMPAWVDSHTHIVYAGSREGEFVDRINGLSYEEIARRGGGILNSAKRLHETSEEELTRQAAERMDEITALGTGGVEIKSGYGLSVEDELKMLRVARNLRERYPHPMRSTFLGAHAIPSEYKDKREDFLKLVTEEMLPQVAEEGLAEYIDVFCEDGFFTPEESDRVLQAGRSCGLIPKVHANELHYSGGVQVGVENGAISVDHLECTGDEEIEALKGSDTMANLLPATAFFLGLEYPPARKMIDAGLPVGLATDYNPGSCPSGRMAFTTSLACIRMGMTPEEAINAATLNSAYAMDCADEIGSIAIGKKANIQMTKAIPSYAFIPYAFGSDLTETVIIGDQIHHYSKSSPAHASL